MSKLTVIQPWRTPQDRQNRAAAYAMAERRARAAVLAARARAAMPEPPADPAILTALVAAFTPPEGHGTREDDRSRPGSAGPADSPTGGFRGREELDPLDLSRGFTIPTDSGHPWAIAWRAKKANERTNQ